MNLIVFVVIGLVASGSGIAANNCEIFTLSMSYNGRYCPGDGIITQNLLPHQCRYICIQSSTCKAYNYNITERACTCFASTCLQALPDTMIAFAVFTQKPVDQCYQWVPYNSGDALNPRMIPTDDPIHYICRMQRSGNDIVCYFQIPYRTCFASWGSSEFHNGQGYPCQRLQIMEDCTVLWVPYTARDPIPPRSVTAGYTTNGDVVYVTKLDYNGKSLGGHYVEGGDHATTGYAGSTRSSTTVMMLVVLWYCLNVYRLDHH